MRTKGAYDDINLTPMTLIWHCTSVSYNNPKDCKKKGYPRFKKNTRSVEYKQSGWKLAKDGMTITFTDGFQAGTFALYSNGAARAYIFLTAKINWVRVIRRADGYDAQFCLDVERKEPGEYTGNVIGIDLGLKHFYTESKRERCRLP
jgi:putative transposase